MSRSQDQTEQLSLLAGSHLPKPTNGPTAELLQTFPNCYPNRNYIIHIEFPEFTSLCPVTGQPDFASICVDYIADKVCVESKSFKYYMFAFREHHSFMETTTNTILDDLVTALDPYWCRVQGLFVPRGGTTIHVFAEHLKAVPFKKQREIRRSVREYLLTRMARP